MNDIHELLMFVVFAYEVDMIFNTLCGFASKVGIALGTGQYRER